MICIKIYLSQTVTSQLIFTWIESSIWKVAMLIISY